MPPKSLIPLLLIAVFLIILNIFCSKQQNWYIVKLSRITSTDSLVDAVIAEDRGGGVFGKINTLIYLVTIGKLINKPETYQFCATHVDSLYLIWRDKNLLEIHYKKANISRFRNLYADWNIGWYNYVREIILIKVGREKIRYKDR